MHILMQCGALCGFVMARRARRCASRRRQTRARGYARRGLRRLGKERVPGRLSVACFLGRLLHRLLAPAGLLVVLILVIGHGWRCPPHHRRWCSKHHLWVGSVGSIVDVGVVSHAARGCSGRPGGRRLVIRTSRIQRWIECRRSGPPEARIVIKLVGCFDATVASVDLLKIGAALASSCLICRLCVRRLLGIVVWRFEIRPGLRVHRPSQRGATRCCRGDWHTVPRGWNTPFARWRCRAASWWCGPRWCGRAASWWCGSAHGRHHAPCRGDTVAHLRQHPNGSARTTAAKKLPRASPRGHHDAPVPIEPGIVPDRTGRIRRCVAARTPSVSTSAPTHRRSLLTPHCVPPPATSASK